jgi:hypothetical protein
MKKEITLGELARELGGKLTGDRDLTVSNISGVEEAKKGEGLRTYNKVQESQSRL